MDVVMAYLTENWLTVIEAVAVVFGAVAVYLNVRQNIWCWPTGLVQVTLYVVIFLQVKLYSDLILHVIYIGMQLYGWYHWLYGGRDKDSLPVTTLEAQVYVIWGYWIVGGTYVWGYLMAANTDAAFPYGDAFTTVASLVAQWFMARKYLESWILWIIVDVVAVVIYWSKGLELTTGLYVLFLGLATMGYFEWRNSMRGSRADG